MSTIKRIPGAVAIAALCLAGCDTLGIQNPNAPDSHRALSDPGTVQSIAIGAMRTWYLTSQGGLGEDQYPTLTLGVMARSHVAAWNNFNIRFYTGCTNGNWDVYTTATNGTCSTESEGNIYPRVEWQNNPASAQRTQIEAYWFGYYSALSSANDVVKAIRVNHTLITDSGTTKMVETMGVLVQGLALGSIALNYDQGFVVSYLTDLSTIKMSPAKDLRDTALARLDEAIALANANTFPVPTAFFGGPAQGYDNVKIVKIANTMAARLLAYFPRNAAQNADVSAGGLVDWTRVAGYASKGISTGAAFDWLFHQDGCQAWCDFLKVWSNDITTMRVHSRVSHLLDPVTQSDPWNISFNSAPNSADKRLGNGTFRGDTSYASLISANPDKTGAGGFDYVWSFDQEAQRHDRGAWHQSAIGQIRYDSLATCGDNPEGLTTGVGDAPAVLAAENDLIWAEALLRKPAPSPAAAAPLINWTRVGPDRLGRPRGGLAAATGTLQEVQYEQDVELLGSNGAPFYNQRRIDKLEPLTPREMPVPAKELGVDQLALYTCGGANHPDGSCDAHPTSTPPLVAALVTDAPRRFAELEQQAFTRFHRNGVKGLKK
jgi:starch-binding outer membrane protein, SusD/RagB family